MRKVSIIFYSNDTDTEYTVDATYTPGQPGGREPFARFAEPDEPDEIEILKIVDKGTGLEVFDSAFSAYELEQIEEQVAEAANEYEYEF